MAIIPTTQNKVALYAAGLYGMKLGSTTNNAVLQDVQFSSANGANGLNAVLNAYYAPFASMTSAQVAAIVVANAGIKAGQYGLTAQNVADAVATVTASLNAAAPTKTQGQTIADVLTDFSNKYESNAVYGAAAKAWNVKITQAVSYSTGTATADIAFGDIVTEFRLSSGGENRTGTAGDDTFIAVQGTFDNADRVNGGDGFDTLKAQVSGVVAPNVSNVEHVQFQAQFRNGNDSGDNNVADEASIAKVDFNTNVTNVTGFTTIENSNSRADLIVEDVRIANNQITKDITIIMRETDPGNVDFGVYFDQNSLRNVSSASSQINLRVLDTYNTSLGNAPLKDSPYGSFTFSYALNGAAAQSVTLESAAIQNAQTFPEMVAALQAAADAKFGAGAVVVSLGSTYTVPDSVTGAQVQGTEIVLAAKGNIVFSTPAGSGWKATDTVPAISGLHTSYTVGGATSTELVTSNIILDDVGRGSTGGDLVVGGLSVGETSTSKGVQKFLIEVQDNSKLQTINSTNNTLREVVLTSGVTTRVDNAYNDNFKDAGNLTVRGFENTSTVPNDGTGNNALPGINTTVPASTANHGEYGFTDVRVIDGSAFRGKLDFDAQITERSIEKYLNLKDTASAQPAADNANFVYTGGLNSDTIAVRLDAGTTVARNLQTGREDFTFSLNGGAGNDTLTLEVNTSGQTANWYANQKTLKNLSIDGGEGNDTIKTPGWGDVKITAGSGDDTVYADNSGTIGAKWVVNQTGFNADPLAGTVPTAFLVGGKVTVSFAPGTAAGGGVTGVSPVTAADAVATAYQNGFEVVADIPTGANYAVTQYHINQAIKAAINNDPVLNKLLVAEDGPASTLNITSKIDGAFAANDLEIVVSSTQGATVAADVLAAYKAFAKNSAATASDVLAANTATVTAVNGVSGVGVDRGALAQTGGSTVAGAVTVNTEGSAGGAGSAGTFETATYTIGAGPVVAGTTVTINGLTVTLGAGATLANLETALETGATAGAAVVSGSYAAGYVAQAGAAGTVVYAATTVGNKTDLTVTGTAGAAAGSLAVTQGTEVVAPSNPATESVTVKFTGTGAAGGENITWASPAGNVVFAIAANDTASQIATKFAAAVTAAGVGGSGFASAVVGTDTTTVVLTGPAATSVANFTSSAFTSSVAGTFANGSISTAESDNTIDLGAGNDVAVLGTGANSNDTIVFTGYNLGKNTIVNFEDTTVASRDLLDFNAYLNGKSSASGSVESQREIDITLNTDAAVEANSVTVLNGTFTATDTFAGLTAEKLLAAVNSTNTGSANYAGITATTLDAVNTYTSNTLVGGVGKAVVLVQNNGNEGEYLAFELSFNATATNTNKDFTAAQLIGTVDFGNSVTFAQNLLVA